MSELRILSYNVRSLRDDVDAVAAVVRACTPDVVAVQEAPRMLRWRSKRAALARKCGMVVGTASRPAGLLIMTTLAARVVSTDFTLLPKSPKLHQRAVQLAEIELRGASWTIASVHFSLDAAERARHLDTLWPALDRASAPLVLAGDINEKPDGVVWRALAARLQDAYAVTPDGPGESYSASNPQKRIDGVFVDPAVEVVGCHAVHEGPDITRGLLAAATDHLPVLALLRQ